jgi:hypothetical protein
LRYRHFPALCDRACRKKFIFQSRILIRVSECVDGKARVRLESEHWNLDEVDGQQSGLGDSKMRRVILALLTAGGFAALGAMPAEAVGTRFPFCIQGDDQPGLSNCTFTSYEQCQATASGRRLWCIANPYYVGDSDAPPYAGRGRRLPPAYPGYPRY